MSPSKAGSKPAKDEKAKAKPSPSRTSSESKGSEQESSSQNPSSLSSLEKLRELIFSRMSAIGYKGRVDDSRAGQGFAISSSSLRKETPPSKDEQEAKRATGPTTESDVSNGSDSHSEPYVDFESFELPFAAEPYEGGSSESDGEEEVDRDEVKDRMEVCIPGSAIYLGTVECEVSNWTSWHIEDFYYLLPLSEGPFNWAMFRIIWDDNWSRWGWSFDARMKGCKDDPKSAAQQMLTALWGHWGYDLEDEEYAEYKEMLEGV
jgi:hypothetical protein